MDLEENLAPTKAILWIITVLRFIFFCAEYASLAWKESRCSSSRLTSCQFLKVVYPPRINFFRKGARFLSVYQDLVGLANLDLVGLGSGVQGWLDLMKRPVTWSSRVIHAVLPVASTNACI